ncbi:tetratricopeptide repeat protein [Shouchella miscanthi]|uniref:response regulator aspartate phosphatase n=1 Tax=Shouchella miscanthi TaxID=2598861 RepID=UPI0011AA0BC7|nr:tetratricopeptide repeat protein [Shouchella miscanthi]
MKTYAVERVGQQIVEWYSCIMTKDIKQAKLLKLEVDIMVANMEPDDKMLAYYQLVSLQYDLLVLREAPDEKTEALDETILENIAVQTNDYLNFMYYYVWGQTEFYKQRYKSAIRTYKIAERLIEKVKDPLEKAEFYQKLGISYYRIDQYTFAFSYLEQALEIFEKDPSYILNVISCKQILAGIHSELKEYEKAEVIYNELIVLSKPYSYYQGLTTYNRGVNRILVGNFEEAIQQFKKALEIEEFRNSAIYLKARYHILNLQMRLGNYTEGLEQLEEEVHNEDAQEIKGKLLICRGLYLNEGYSFIEEGINLLQANEYYDECRDLCEEISKHYKKMNDFEMALYYLECANEMSNKTILGVDQS